MHAKPDEADPSPEGTQLRVGVKLLREGARLPSKAYEADAAFDLYAAEGCRLQPLTRAVVGTGIALNLPPGIAALTLPRSGLAAGHGISLVNAPGLIDPGYRGEIKLILLNTDSREPFDIRAGDRVAQLLLISLTPLRLHETTDLDASDRGARGFGSTGRE